jgi:hypothetical protein
MLADSTPLFYTQQIHKESNYHKILFLMLTASSINSRHSSSLLGSYIKSNSYLFFVFLETLTVSLIM